MNADTTDILEVTQGTTHGANLFAYCNNNPVNVVDYGGMLGVVGTIIIAIIILMIFSFIINEDDPYNKSIFTALRDYKISKVLKKYPVLSALFGFNNGLNDVLNVFNEYVEVFLLYYAHSKNIVDYGTGINSNPNYPDYNGISSSSYTYKEKCAEAYIEATEIGLITKGKLWKHLTPEEQYVFVKGMVFYDYDMWRDLTLFSTKKMGMWGTEEIASFYFGFIDILNK